MYNEVDSFENNALKYLPERIKKCVLRCMALYGNRINEIRLRKNSPVSLTINDKNILLSVEICDEEIKKTVSTLCDNSLYAHADTIREGYIITSEGMRIGVCGRAVTDKEKINSVYDISSVVIRIPRRVNGAGDRAYELLKMSDFLNGLLVWSVPGGGKTTLLRELCIRLSESNHPRRVSVIDTRYEICTGIQLKGTVDVLSGYPRPKGIEIAKRTLTPQIIICDEIGTEDDAEAIFDAYCSGITVVASVHASNKIGLKQNNIVRKLIDQGIFGSCIGLTSKITGGFEYDIEYFNEKAVCPV